MKREKMGQRNIFSGHPDQANRTDRLRFGFVSRGYREAQGFNKRSLPRMFRILLGGRPR